MSALIPGEQRQAVLLDSVPLEEVDKLKYLDSMFIAKGQGFEEMKNGINLESVVKCTERRPFTILRSGQ